MFDPLILLSNRFNVTVACIFAATMAIAADFPCDAIPSTGVLLSADAVPYPDLRPNGLKNLAERLSPDATRLAMPPRGASVFEAMSGEPGRGLAPHVDGRLPLPRDTANGPDLSDLRQPRFDLPRLTPLEVGPLIALVPPPKLPWDTRTKLVLGDLQRALVGVQQQSDPQVATGEVKRRGVLNLSPAEQDRLSASTPCSEAFKLLVTTFESNRDTMGFWTERERTVAHFIPWYYQSSQAARDKAAPVILAQERYERACLEEPVPPELNPSLIKRAVGVLMFGDKVFCTAFRLAKTEVLTAKHCFLDAETGTPLNDVTAALNNSKEQMWFTYEAEPSHRFGVCRASLPKGGKFGPKTDNIRLRISPTNLPPAPWKWASTPIETGTSLYLRGFFPFTGNSAPSIGRLRSTAAGGCFAHSASEHCFFHACQTTPIMSGAPIFIRAEPGVESDKLVIAGIHLGPAFLSDPKGTYGSVCREIDGTKVPSSNFGYQPF